jgi:uncharacterized RDD family membrane protein YckC
MQITCPSCNYSKQINPAMLPPDTTRATCPKCGQCFELYSTEQEAVEKPQIEADSTQQPELAPQRIVSDALPKAGFWIRVVATLLDAAIVLTLQLVLGLMLVLAGVISVGNSETQLIALITLGQLFGFAINCAYYVIFTGHGGQTPGKMALRIKVIKCDGSDLGYGQAAFREIAGKFISAIILCIGYLMVAFDDQKQGLHDRMSDTYVIKL